MRREHERLVRLRTGVRRRWHRLDRVPPLPAAGQFLVVNGPEPIVQPLPFTVLGIDSDIDSVFINVTIAECRAERGIEFTPTRSYRKNDQAWVEPMNGAAIRRLLGYELGPGSRTKYHVSRAIGLYVAYFQPLFRLMGKTRNGSAVTEGCSPPATPRDRVPRREAVISGTKTAPSKRRATLDQVELLHTIRGTRATLETLVSSELRPTSRGGISEQVPGQATRPHEDPERADAERRANHRAPGKYGRTLSMACSANCWAVSRKTRNAIAVELQGRLQVVEQVHFSQVLLRTLQRRVQQWVRHHNGRSGLRLVRGNAVGPWTNAEIALVASDAKCRVFGHIS